LDDYTDPKRLMPQADQDEKPGRRFPRGLLFIPIVLLAGGAALLYWLHARHYETTDDAFVDAHISQVSAQVSGRIVRLLAQDNARVVAGQVLAEIDPRDAAIRLDQMTAQRDQAAAQLAQARATLPARQADLDQATANIGVAQADLLQSERDMARYNAINPHAITAQIIDQARASLSAAKARLEAARQAQAAARAQIEIARAQVDEKTAALRMAEANLADAQLQSARTSILAPADGRITRRTVEVGNYVVPGQSLLAIVQPECWVTANFKEGQLADMHPGQPARVTVDAFPNETLAAHVDSLQSGTGSVFSSLPAENATGNYVKIVQRLPVKLVFEGDACRRLALAPGMSAEPRITVR
jgi:membrane fusion protein (multidrug efflux system)